MNMKNMFLLLAVLAMAGCEAVDRGYFPGGRMQIISATYGLNCGAPRGNATSDIARACSNATSQCDYRVDVNALGDPRPGCAKDYEVEYRCGLGGTRTASAPAEAGSGAVVTLQCTNEIARRSMEILSATYGLNCGAPRGNATSHIAQACSNATSQCDYRIDVNALGDPRPGCAKDYEVEYRCARDGTRRASAPAEAGKGTVITLQCTR